MPRFLSLRLLPALLAAGVFAAAPALAQSPEAPAVRAVRVEADNDAFNFWVPVPRPDHEYSHGVRMVVEADRAAGWGWLAPSARPCTGGEAEGERCLSTRWEVGQKIFTPRRDAPAPLPGERPYAGWLYASGEGRVEGGALRRSLAVEVGVTGPPSLAEEVQTAYHALAGYWEPLGWQGQLAFEPGVVARYEESRLLVDAAAGGVRFATVAPHWRVSAGNVHTGAEAGVRAQLGYGVAHPWRAPGTRRGTPVALYAAGGARGEWVVRSLFLDGNTFRAGPRVEKLPLVAETEVGVGVRVKRLVVEYRVATRGREYRTEPAAHRWATITVGVQRSY